MSKTLTHKMLDKVAAGTLSPRQAEEELRNTFKFTTKAKDQSFRVKVAKENIKNMYNGREYVSQRMNVEVLYATLNLSEAGAFYRILSFMQWGENGLLISNNKTMKMADLEKIISLSSSQTKTTINKLVEVGLVNKNGGKKNQTYSVNQDYCFMGEPPDGKTEPFTKLFKIVARDWIKPRLTLKQQGFFLKLTPYINYTTHFIAENPMERVVTKIIPMSLDSIAEKLSLSTKTVRSHIKALGGAGILKDLGDAGSAMSDRMFFLNPQAAHRGKIDTNQFLDVQIMFEDLHKKLKEQRDAKITAEVKQLIQRAGARHPHKQ